MENWDIEIENHGMVGLYDEYDFEDDVIEN
jgi:hypothetical protein